MDLQNVKNITIPEGNVNNIHDKDGKLLWGRLAYDTKYAGNTFQQTYSGKNLFNKNGTYITAGGTGESVSVIDTGIKVTYGTIGDSVAARFMIGEASSLVGKTITLSANVSKSASGLAPGMYIGVSNADLSSVQRMSDYVSGTGSKSVSWTVTEDNTKPYIMVALYVTNGGSPSQGDYSSYENAQLEVGSTPTSYEPYVGGTASPNPDYPQDIDVVTGTQTLQITAGTESEDFTVDLGSIELCKIGTYQDYIYKSGDDWYVHKACGKVVLDGSDDEGWRTTGYNRVVNNSIYGLLYNSGSVYNYYSNQLRNANSENTENSFNVGGSAIFVKATSKTTNISDWTTWLSSNNLIIYGALATPTDTKITDSTLITQLNAIHKWLTRYGYLPSVTGNLPLIINQTNL